MKNIKNNRNQRKNIAENTLEILTNGAYTTELGVTIAINTIQENAINGTKLYTPDESDKLIEGRNMNTLNSVTVFEVDRNTTLNSVRRLLETGNNNIVYLNFASAKNPGGGFLGGSQAQEESIARSTGLHPCLEKEMEYYEVNRKTKSCFYTDYMIYSPDVPIIKNEDGELLNKIALASVITAPAVNTGAVIKQEPERVNEIEVVMKRRIEKVLSIALEHNHDTIVLGAWGCGVFKNDPNDISKYFKDVINSKFKNEFKKVVFAIYTREERFFTPFEVDFMN